MPSVPVGNTILSLEIIILMLVHGGMLMSISGVEYWDHMDVEWMDNDAGKELLSFLSCQEAPVCNTWFEKRPVHQHTWHHPKSMRWSCIDFVAMSQQDKQYCLLQEEVPDHHIVCSKLCFGRRHCSGASR